MGKADLLSLRANAPKKIPGTIISIFLQWINSREGCFLAFVMSLVLLKKNKQKKPVEFRSVVIFLNIDPVPYHKCTLRHTQNSSV